MSTVAFRTAPSRAHEPGLVQTAGSHAAHFQPQQVDLNDECTACVIIVVAEQ